MRKQTRQHKPKNLRFWRQQLVHNSTGDVGEIEVYILYTGLARQRFDKMVAQVGLVLNGASPSGFSVKHATGGEKVLDDEADVAAMVSGVAEEASDEVRRTLAEEMGGEE